MEQTANFYDVVVIGGGPAGLTAALYLARARYRVVVVEKNHFGGQITITSEVVNYPGVGRTSGTELTETMRKQAEGFGAEFLLAEVTGLELSGDIKTVRTGRGDLRCFGVLLATGAHPRMVGFQGEEQFRGRGVAYCATCDGEFFTGKDVFVVGGGFAAAEESVFLTKYARQVTILIRGDDFTCAQATADAARSHEKITVLTNTEVEEVSGDTSLRYLRYRNTKTGQVTKHHAADGETFGVFVFAGYEPATELVCGLAELNDQGYILTDRSQKTTADGLYAAGDVCVKPLRQVVTAVGDGALAATELERLCAAADILGCAFIRGFAFFAPEEGPLPAETLAPYFERPVRLLEQRGKTLLLEADPSVNTSNHAALARLVEAIGSPRVRAIFDPGNCLYDPLGETPYPDGYEAIRPFFAHVHIKDAVRAVPESYCVKVGTGQVGYPALLRRLAADGYAGWLSMETHYRLDSHLTEEQMRLPGGAGFSAGGAAATAESVAALKDILQKEGLL